MTTILDNQTITNLASYFEANLAAMPGGSALQALRRNAFSSFTQQGFPTKRNEEYKYSTTDKIVKEDYFVGNIIPTTITSKAISKYEITGLNATIIVLINGVFSNSLSEVNILNNDIIICSLLEAFDKYPELIKLHYDKYIDANNDAFSALNTAFANDGVFLFIKDKEIIETPIHIINIIDVNEQIIIQPRHLIVVGKQAEVKLIETFHTHNNSSKYILNTAAEIVVNENAKVQYYKIQNEDKNAVHINTTQAHQESNSHFDTNVVTLGGGWIRNNLNIELQGQNCESHLNGLFILKDNQHLDNHTLVDHKMPHCESNQLYKGILDEKSTGVFNGKIFVRPDAQKTNAYQSSKNILLSDDATINTKPQLEIYADDVKCSHGSSTGQIDTDALFYLKARGIGEDSARKLLMYAFASDVVNTIRIDALREYVDVLITQNL